MCNPAIEGLQSHGLDVIAYDPVATSEMHTRFFDVTYADSAAVALEDTHGVVNLTDYVEFVCPFGGFIESSRLSRYVGDSASYSTF